MYKIKPILTKLKEKIKALLPKAKEYFQEHYIQLRPEHEGKFGKFLEEYLGYLEGRIDRLKKEVDLITERQKVRVQIKPEDELKRQIIELKLNVIKHGILTPLPSGTKFISYKDEYIGEAIGLVEYEGKCFALFRRGRNWDIIPHSMEEARPKNDVISNIENIGDQLKNKFVRLRYDKQGKYYPEVYIQT